MYLNLLAWFRGLVRQHRINAFWKTAPQNCNVRVEFDGWGRVRYYELNSGADDDYHDDWWNDRREVDRNEQEATPCL